MTKIKINVWELDKAIQQLEVYRKQLYSKRKTFMEKLAEIGIETAEMKFGSAIYDGTNDVVVNQKPKWVSKNKLVITATGKAITFIEFGSGVHYADPKHPKAQEFGFSRGGFGYGLGKFDTWRYEGEAGTNGEVITDGKHAGEILTHGNPANRCMYEASEKMKEQIVKIAEEVFRND